jgi:hypothetical protein
MYLSVYILQMAFHPIALGGHYVLWRSALQERVDVVERSRNAADRELEPLNRNRAAPNYETMAGLQKACNEVRYCVRGVICLVEVQRLSRRRHLRDVDTSCGSKTVSVGIWATCSATIGENWLPSLLAVMDAPLAAGFLKAFTVRRADILGR